MVKHQNIVELHEVMVSKTKIYFTIEYVKGGELLEKVVKGKLRENNSRGYFQQLISKIDFFHSRGAYQMDINPENLLLDEKGNPKVTDYGLIAFTNHLRQDGLLRTTCVLLLILPLKYVVIMDIILQHKIFCHVELFFMKIHKGYFKCPPWVSSDSRKLIGKMLDPNLRTRITA
uniref:Protein kinase domain-containing protein n=1 Tax=Solanum lycopersicum TaxID=4081 RepID=A0A3Q7IV46_SOLLC